MNERLNIALSREEEMQKEEEVEINEEPSKIDTTEEELEGYNIVLAIMRRKIGKERIVFRDTQSYFGILLDDNNRKPICRVHLNGGVKHISLFDKNKNVSKKEIDSIDDIYQYEKQLLEVVDYYDD